MSFVRWCIPLFLPSFLRTFTRLFVRACVRPISRSFIELLESGIVVLTWRCDGSGGVRRVLGCCVGGLLGSCAYCWSVVRSGGVAGGGRDGMGDVE